MIIGYVSSVELRFQVVPVLGIAPRGEKLRLAYRLADLKRAEKRKWKGEK